MATSRTPRFTKDELETLLAVADTVLPSVTTEELMRRSPTLIDDVATGILDVEDIDAFASERPSQNPKFRQALEALPSAVPPHKLDELKQLLGLMHGRIGTVVLTGGITPFHMLSQEDRERQLLSWKMSRLATYRKVYDALVKLCMSLYVRNSEFAHRAMDYLPAKTARTDAFFDFKFTPPDELRGLQLDAIIVGSGSGGGVVAKTLAENGMKVVVLEKGRHWDGHETLSEAQALADIYQGGGFTTNDYGDTAVISAQVFGGGSTVNWAASLQPPRSVREDWVKTTGGLSYFNSAEFQDDLDAVCDYMGVSLPRTHNMQNRMLLEGARRLGYAAAEVPQNNGGDMHLCNHDCGNGCASGGKKGGVHSWLVDAARHGAHFATNCDVRRILLSPERVATGVVLVSPAGGEYTLSAPRIIVAGGSIETPALLLRSKVPNPRIGTTLYLHPTNYVYGIFPQRTRPTQGNILTSVVTEFANMTPSGHGVRIETGIMQPGVGLTLLQWMGGAEHKARLLSHSHMAGLIAIARDSKPGRVVLDKRGEAVVHYSVAPRDAAAVQKGTLASAACLRTMGATEIIVAGRGIAPWKAGDDVEAWEKQVTKTLPGCFGSAHQMASCRMAARGGVCDPSGKVNGVKGIWIADASVLPSASGVNPMVSTMAVARKIARGIVAEHKLGGVEPAARL